MDIKEVMRKLKNRNMANIARDTGVHHVTIHNIATGKTAKPHKKTLEKIIDWLEKN